MTSADIRFYFDPVCPFCWLTSKWIRMVQAERGFTVDWRFISLRLINSHIDYDAHFPPEYEAGHTAGLRLLRVAARARAEHDPQRGRVLRPGDQPAARTGAGRRAVGPRAGPGPVPRVFRAETEPARAAAAGRVRGAGRRHR
jgi:hypothetical protein